MQRQDRIAFESALAKMMLEEVIDNAKIKSVLTEIATKLRHLVFARAVEIIRKSEQNEDMNSSMKDVLHSWAIQHSNVDLFLGALLPDYSLEELEHTARGRSLLLSAMEKALSNEHINQLKTLHDVISFLKTLDGMGYFYLSNAYPKFNPNEYEKIEEYETIKSMISPSVDESDMRCPRDKKMLAITYGIGTELEDFVSQEKQIEGCYSGKARFFIPSAEECFEKLANQFDLADQNGNEKEKQILTDKLRYYHISLNKNERDPQKTAKDHTPWFKKLARENNMPLIASASMSTSRALITLLHIGAFHKADMTFDLDKAQIYINCLMGYYVFCGHHSFLEVMEIWNRMLDYVAIYHKDQLPKGIFPEMPSDQPYFHHPIVEQCLPYGIVGNYKHFLHASYEIRLLDKAKDIMQNQGKWLPLTQYRHLLGQSIFNRFNQPEVELTDENVSEYNACKIIKN